MSIPGSLTPLFSTGSSAATGYQVSRSLRFNSADSAYLSRVFPTITTNQLVTFSAWVKRAALGTRQCLIDTNRSYQTNIDFLSTNSLAVYTGNGAGVGSFDWTTTQVFRDCGAWYHILAAWDTTQGIATDRLKVYVNGQEITTWSSQVAITQNMQLGFSGTTALIGNSIQTSYLSAYLGDIHFIEGQQLTPSSFTEVSATTGQLIPLAYSGSYGTNGFYLQFADNSSNTDTTLGKDTSPNGNNWTPVNLSTNTGGPTSVAAASGGIPVLNTTDTYGATLGSGVSADAYASSLVLDLPLTAQGGRAITDDVSPSGRTSGTKTFTNLGVSASTSISKFYGGSSLFANPSTRMTTPTSSDFILGATYTIECWIYRTSSSRGWIVGDYTNVNQPLDSFSFEANNASSLSFTIIYANASLLYDSYTWSYTNYNVWDHVALVRNGSGDPVLYVNGVLQGAPSYGGNAGHVNVISGSTQPLSVGGVLGSYAFNGNLQDLRIYRGAAKYTSNFNPPSSTANATIGAGNDSLVDTPTSFGTDTGVGGEVRGNYATFNPLDLADFTLSNGNLNYSKTSTTWKSVRATVGVNSGKWYYEYQFGSDSRHYIGISQSSMNIATYPGATSTSYSIYLYDGYKSNNGVDSSYASAFTSTDILGVAFDLDAATVTFYKNGTSLGTAFTGIASGYYFPTFGTYLSGETGTVNFGQRPFAYQTPGTNRPAATFLALCDTNLPAPLVAKPNQNFDIITYTGTGATQTLPNANSTPSTPLAFSPDFIWTKSRSRVDSHGLHDIVRGRASNLYSDLTAAENTSSLSADLVSFDANGYTLGTVEQTAMNRSGETYVGWAWDAGTTTDPSNQAGSITSQVRANVSAGFSVATWTGTGSGSATIGHGLGVKPRFILVKKRNATGPWYAQHGSLGAGQIAYLSSDSAFGATSGWNNTEPTSTVFSLGSAINDANTYVAYCFAPVVGYSSFGSYVGNASSDGPFVYTGFRPRWIMIKNATLSGGNWRLIDTARETYNVGWMDLYANDSTGETAHSAGTTNQVDILSNGFKLRDALNETNRNGDTLVWAAFAENPFQYARAR